MSPIHWVILLVVVLLVFGTGKLKNIGSDLGAAVKGFKKSMEDSDAKESKHLLGKKDAEFDSVSQGEKSEHKS